MSLMKLLEFVAAGLKSQPSIILNTEAYYRRSGSRDVPLNRETGNRIASAAHNTNVAPYASLELFQRPDTKEIYYFLIFARSWEDWQTAMSALQQRVLDTADEPSEIATRIIVEHTHNNPTGEDSQIIAKPR